MVGQEVAYVRVSSTDQNPERQYESIGAVDKIFEDRVSGKSADRPALQEMLAYVREGDTIRVASLDRFARNLADLRGMVTALTGRGVRVTFIKEGLTFTGEDSAMSVLLLNMLGAVAEFERSLIRERQAEGVALAKQKGVYKGRARALSPEQIEEARQHKAAGMPVAAVARTLGVARQTLYDAMAGRGVYATPTGSGA